MDRYTALTTSPVIRLDVYPTIYHRSRGGHIVTVSTDDLLPTDVRVTRTFGLSPQSFTARFSWSWGWIEPSEFSIDQSWGQVFVDGEPALFGRVTSWEYDDEWQEISVTISEAEITASGDFWEPNAELDSDRFADIANTGNRARATNSSGLLAPIPIAPVGSALYSPCLIVADDVAAVSGVSDLVPYQLLISEYKPADTSSSHTFLLVDDEQESIVWSDTTAINAGSDYWYIDNDFVTTFGAGVTTFAATPAVTCTLQGGLVGVGDLIRNSVDGNQEWVEVDSIEGSAITLIAAYGGTAGAGQTGDLIRLPANVGYPAYWSLALGGIAHPEAPDRPLSEVMDVLAWTLRAAQLSESVAWGDLVALGSRLRQWHVSTVLTKRIDPLEWADEKLLSWIPVRPLRIGGYVRFRWAGPIDERDIVATIDDIVSARPVRVGEAAIPLIQLECRWSIRTQRHEVAASSYQRSGRAIAAETRVRDEPGRRLSRPPIELDSIEDADLALHSLVYRLGFRRRVVELELDAGWRWLEPGDVIRYTGVAWRIEIITLTGEGLVELTLMEV